MDTYGILDPASKPYNRYRSIYDLFQFERDIKRIISEGHDIALICYDITSLRKINHAYGRKTGDAVLTEVASYVAQTTCGSVYRIEGDLYCVIVKSCKQDYALHLARRIEKRFEKPWDLDVDGQEIILFISISISVIEPGPFILEEFYQDLFERALDYSRKAKDVTVFDHETERVSLEQIRMQMDLKSCILRGMVGFDVFFQPIADPISGTWISVEALCRWNRPGHGSVSPYTFIKEAEEMGYIHNIGSWVLETAIKTCKDLGLDGLDSFFVSINVSALQIVRHDFVESVISALTRHNYPSGKLLLEITESTEFIINNETRSTIESLRDYGVKLALDDFGTGYSSFSSLKNTPVDYLKTEREFIQNIEEDSYLQYFFFVMSEVAHSNNMKLIAEGVETKEQLECVVRNGANLIQGYFFGRPLSRASLEEGIHYFKLPSDDIRYVPKDYIDFQKWISSKEAYSITPSLFILLNRCMDILLNASSPDASVNAILSVVGKHFKVNRAYVFLCDEGAMFSNRYEWCAEGIKSQMALLQDVDGNADGFYDILTKNKAFITTSRAQIPENLKLRLQKGGQEDSIQSMIVMPMTRKDTVIGFVGFDDDRPRKWTPEEMILLHNLCLLVLIVLSSQGFTA